MESIANFHFIRPAWLLLAPVAIVIWWFWRRSSEPLRGWRRQIDPDLLKVKFSQSLCALLYDLFLLVRFCNNDTEIIEGMSSFNRLILPAHPHYCSLLPATLNIKRKKALKLVG